MVDQRAFARFCLLGAGAVFRSGGPVQAPPPPSAFLTRYNKALLTTASGETLRAGGLEREEDYIIFASGLLGLDSFDRFFRGFREKGRAQVEGQTAVMRLREYSAAIARC